MIAVCRVCHESKTVQPFQNSKRIVRLCAKCSKLEREDNSVRDFECK